MVSDALVRDPIYGLSAGALALLILDKVFAFVIKQRKNGKESSGEQSPEYWQGKFREIVRDELAIFVERMQEARRQLLATLDRVVENQEKLVDLKHHEIEKLQEGQDRILTKLSELHSRSYIWPIGNKRE